MDDEDGKGGGIGYCRRNVGDGVPWGGSVGVVDRMAVSMPGCMRWGAVKGNCVRAIISMMME